MTQMIKCMRGMLDDTQGATLVEYTLVLTLIAIVCIVAIRFFGTSTSTVLNSAATSI
jgi:Flp pilus assembly pilin Flp